MDDENEIFKKIKHDHNEVKTFLLARKDNGLDNDCLDSYGETSAAVYDDLVLLDICMQNGKATGDYDEAWEIQGEIIERFKFYKDWPLQMLYLDIMEKYL